MQNRAIVFLLLLLAPYASQAGIFDGFRSLYRTATHWYTMYRAYKGVQHTRNLISEYRNTNLGQACRTIIDYTRMDSHDTAQRTHVPYTSSEEPCSSETTSNKRHGSHHKPRTFSRLLHADMKFPTPSSATWRTQFLDMMKNERVCDANYDTMQAYLQQNQESLPPEDVQEALAHAHHTHKHAEHYRSKAYKLEDANERLRKQRWKFLGAGTAAGALATVLAQHGWEQWRNSGNQDASAE